ncbi:MAG: hypothetical protein WDN44_01210 [Sphingomonas sp.]
MTTPATAPAPVGGRGAARHDFGALHHDRGNRIEIEGPVVAARDVPPAVDERQGPDRSQPAKVQAAAGDVRARTLLGRRRAGDRAEGRNLIERVADVGDVEVLRAFLADHVDRGRRIEAGPPQARAGDDDLLAGGGRLFLGSGILLLSGGRLRGPGGRSCVLRRSRGRDPDGGNRQCQRRHGTAARKCASFHLHPPCHRSVRIFSGN